MRYKSEEYVSDGDRADYFQYQQYQDYPHPQTTGSMNNTTNNNKRIDRKDWMIIGGVLASTALVASLFGGGRPRVAPQYAQPHVAPNGTVTIPGNGGQPTVINFDND